MTGSLRDQMLKAGLVDEKQTKLDGRQSRKARKARRKASQLAGVAMEAQIESERRAKVQRDRALNQARDEARQARETGAQVQQIVERHRIEREAGDFSFSFQRGDTIRSLQLSRTQRDALVAGSLALADFGEVLELIPGSVAGRIAERSPESIACWHEPGDDDASEPDPNDPYAGYEIPDDLTW